MKKFYMGISALNHKSSVTLIDNDGTIICSTQEEDHSNIKGDESWPEKSIAWSIEFANSKGYASNLTKKDITFGYYEYPWLKFLRRINQNPSNIMKFFKAIWGFFTRIVVSIQYRTKKKYKRLYEVYNSDAKEHIGLKLRGLPKPGAKVIIKGGTSDEVSRHFEVYVLAIFELKKEQKDNVNISRDVDAYYIDGRYNDIEIKRIK